MILLVNARRRAEGVAARLAFVVVEYVLVDDLADSSADSAASHATYEATDNCTRN